MVVDLSTSLFADKSRVDGSEVKFRVLCGLGWQLYKRLPELRTISQRLPESWFFYINQIEQVVLQAYPATTREALTWPTDMQASLMRAVNHPHIRPLPLLCNFLESLAADMPKLESLLPGFHFGFFNDAGFRMAVQMVRDAEWSSAAAMSRWQPQRPMGLKFVSDSVGNFQPVTPPDKAEIQIRVNTADFDYKNSLLYFLTLEYQMMHEYISHFLPAWDSGNALEHEYLQAVMFLYCRARRQPRDGIHIYLVDRADEARADAHRPRRMVIQDELAPLLTEAVLSRHLMTLAVLDENEMSAAKKRHLLALMNHLPVSDPQLEAAIESWFVREDLDTIYARLVQAFPSGMQGV